MKTLVVEDDSIVRDILLEVLSCHGLSHGAANGLEGLGAFQSAWAQNDPYDLICLDIMMPELDGQETLQIIRQIEASHDINPERQAKVIMITALNDNENIIRAIEQGCCNAYLTKPVTFHTLGIQLEQLGLVEKVC